MNRIFTGDCRDTMRQLIADGVKVNTVVTSPPYWGMRDYGIPPSIWGGDPAHQHVFGKEGRKKRSGGVNNSTLGADHHLNGLQMQDIHQKVKRSSMNALTGAFCECGAWRGCLGLEPDYRLYLENMVEVFSLVWELLRDDGTLWLNLGDTYISSGGAGFQGKHGDRYDRTHTQRALLKSRVGGALKNKDLAMMPHRTAIALQEWGWWVRSDIVWRKPNPTPESVYDRPTKSHEYLFLLTKSAKVRLWRARDTLEWSTTPDLTERITLRGKPKRRWRGFDYFYDADAIKEPASPNTHARMARAHNGYAPPGQNEHHGILAPRPNINGVNPKARDRRPAGWDESAGSHRELIGRYARQERGKQNESFSEAISSAEVVKFRNKRSVWTVATAPYKEAHFATFPPKLIEPCILAGCPAGGTVLDPFVGSGTTAMEALRLGRNYIGCDISTAYQPLQEKRLRSVSAGLALA